jgi:hypothetical protein
MSREQVLKWLNETGFPLEMAAASADLMMSRASSCGSSSTGRIPGCNRAPLLAIYDLEERLLDGGVHTRLLGDAHYRREPEACHSKPTAATLRPTTTTWSDLARW